MSMDKKRILVVDDEAAVTRMIKLNLEATEAYEVKMENSANHALATAVEFQPDLIFMDVMMPGMDGGQLASLVQAHPKLKSVPIVFLTAAVSKTEVLKGGGRIGGLPFMAKPVNTLEMLACIHRCLPAPATTTPPERNVSAAPRL